VPKVENDDLDPIAVEFKKTIPLWAANLVIVAMFLGYMIRQDWRDDLVAKQRIDRCHTIQEDATEVMKALNSTLTEHRLAFSDLENTLADLQSTLTAHNNAVTDYSRQMEAMNRQMGDLLERLERLEKAEGGRFE